MAPGRRPGRELNDLEREHLMLLLETRERARKATAHYDELLENFALQLKESGASARGIAEIAGVGFKSVSRWINNARERRGN